MKTLLTLQELSAETGIPVATLYTYCAPAGDLAVVRRTLGPSAKRKTRGRIHVERTEWDAWVARHRQAPSTQQQRDSVQRAVTRQSVSDLPGADRYAE